MQMRGLGRGLSSLIPGGAPAQEAPTTVAVADIHPNPTQPRQDFDAEALQELAESIAAQGIIQPLVVRPAESGYELIAGERRWRAAQIAGLTEVPVVVRQATDTEMLQLALVENIQREDLSAIERAFAYQRLIDDFGLTQEELAHATGRSRPTIANTLRLLRLPTEVQARIRSGHLTEGHGRALLQLASDAERQLAAMRIESRGLSVREAEKLVQRMSDHKPAAAPPKPAPERASSGDPFLADLENALRTVLGTDVEITPTRAGRGSIRIRYYDADDLERITRMITTFGATPDASVLGLTDPL